MHYRISAEPGYLKAELFNRRTAEETRAFLVAVATEGLKHGLRRGLLSARDSVAIFSLERYGFSAFLKLAEQMSDRIALIADSRELRLAQEYAAMMARWRGINVRTFRDEAEAVAWLTNPRERRGAVKRASSLPATGQGHPSVSETR
jgi:hypothetical protein